MVDDQRAKQVLASKGVNTRWYASCIEALREIVGFADFSEENKKLFNQRLIQVPVDDDALRVYLKKELKPSQYKQIIKKTEHIIKRKNKNDTLEEKGQMVWKPYSLKKVKEKFHEWLFFTDEDVIEVVFAFAIGEKLPGDPLWLFLIGSPGAGKTELIRTIDSDDYYSLSDLTPQSFIGGMVIGKGDKRKKVQDLLPQLDGKVLLLKDFTTILEKHREIRSTIISQLREIYDGSFSKKFGSMDKKVEYFCRFGLIAATTPVVDKYWKVMQQLGERFLKYRWHEDPELTTKRANKNEGQEKQMRKELKAVVNGYLSNLEIEVPQIDEAKHEQFFIEVAMFVALCRTPISIQDYRTEFYFDFKPMPETPTRLVKQLKKLAKALMVVRQENDITDNIKRIIIKVARHTCPQDRLDILDVLRNFGPQCPMSHLKKVIKIPESSLYRVLTGLELLNIVEKKAVTEEIRGVEKKYSVYTATEYYPVTFTEWGSIRSTPDNGGNENEKNK